MRALLALVLCAACAADEIEKPDLCVGSASAAVKQADRRIIGQASDYPADPSLPADDEDFAASQSARRAMAWRVVERALAPIAVAEERLGGATVPRWQTWYAKDDFERMFARLFAGLDAAGRAARAPFGAAAIDEAFAWNVTSVSELPTWPEERYLEYLAAIDESVEVAGVAGNHRVGYSPGAARHLLASYARELDCVQNGVPDPLAAGAGAAGRATAREQAELAACEAIEYGPYLVAEGGTLTAVLSGSGDADLAVRGPGGEACRSRGRDADELCEVAVAGLITVVVTGYAERSAVELTVEYDQAADAASFADCVDGEHPADAALVKADWRRSDFGETLPIYDTTAARMTSRFAGAGDWGPGDGQADPGPEEIYSLRLPNGNSYRMPALHIMTKELRHWVWITLWWSPEPDRDFGEDRPDFIRALPGPWKNYKMCVVTAFTEGDARPDGGLGGELGAALAAVHGGAGGPSWCSNPYLEVGAGNARSTCIGCHQHGGTDTAQEDILALPHDGRTRLRNNFPTDYLWAINAGDELGRAIEAEVTWWDTAE